MQRLAEQNINTKEEYDRIFKVRKQKGEDEFDARRWKTLLKHYKGGRLIDLGCLDSSIPIMAKSRYPKAEIYGIDQAEEAINNMMLQYPSINYQVGDIYKLEFPDEFFNYVVMGEVLEHLDEPWKAISEAMRVLKVGGTLAISVPLNEAKEPGAVDKDRHLWSFTLEDMNLVFSRHKMKFQILRSIQKPVYKYCWPQLLVWVKKGE